MVQQCTYPLTGVGCVKRIYTDLCTLACTPTGLQLIDLVPGLTLPELEQLVGLPIRPAKAGSGTSARRTTNPENGAQITTAEGFCMSGLHLSGADYPAGTLPWH